MRQTVFDFNARRKLDTWEGMLSHCMQMAYFRSPCERCPMWETDSECKCGALNHIAGLLKGSETP